MESGKRTEVDVVIVGGGIMGSSSAYHLARDTDLDVHLLEKTSIGSGSTGKSSGIIRLHYGAARYYSEMAYYSYQFWTHVEDHLGTDVGFTQNGIMYFARDDDDHGELDGYEILQDLGADVEKLTVDECRDLVPHVTADDYDYAIINRDAGFADPAAANQAFYENAIGKGVTVETGVEVTEITLDSANERVTGVKTTDGTIAADSVVLAAGPWSKGLAETVDVGLPITPTREQILLLSPNDAFFEKYPYPFPTITSKVPGHVYFRPDPVNNVLVGGHHRGQQANPDHYKEDADLDYIEWAIDKIDERAPPLTRSDLIQGYSGIYSNTPDKDFIIDEPINGLVCLAGFSGHGFKHSPIVGEIATNLVTTGTTDLVDLERFSLSRFNEEVQTRESL